MNARNTIKDAKTFLEALATPDWFAKTITEHKSDSGKMIITAVFAMIKNEIEITIYMYPDEIARAQKEKSRFFGSLGDGHTSFDTSKGRMTFDRHGVEDSFYVEADDTVETVNAKIVEQIQKVTLSRERLARSLTMPDYGYNLTPERLEKERDTLRRGGVARFAPSGFGTGHLISTKPRGRYNCVRASQALIDFFGVGVLFVETFDHD